jgi:carboxyl-terminal processing protease
MRRLTRFSTFFFLVLGLLGGGAYSFTGQAVPARTFTVSEQHVLSSAERVNVFEQVWETINQRYYDPSFKGVDWRAVRDGYRPLVEKAGTDEEFYEILKKMVGELHDAHTRFHTPEQRRERERLQAVSAGLSIFEVEGKTVVVSVEPDSDAARAGVEPGMIVLQIDGKSIEESLAQANSRVTGTSTDRAVRLRLFRILIDGDPGSTLRMRLARADGSTLDVALIRRIVSDNAAVTSRRLKSGFGYVRLTLWKSPIRKQFKKALEHLRDTPGVIVDIRGNPGGEADEVVKIASFFFNQHVPFGKFSRRSGRAIYLRTDDDDQIYKGPLAILINEGSGSGSELFAGVMQENGRAVIVGRRSCGCVLGISEFKKFKGGGELAVSEYGYSSPRENTYEGTGVVPDKTVDLKISDLQAKRDSALEEAERSLKAKSDTRASALSASRSNEFIRSVLWSALLDQNE